MTIDTTLAELAVRLPAASRVFHRLGLDFCCQGRRPLGEACRTAGLNPAEVLRAIASEPQPSSERPPWAARPLPELVAHLLERYHQPLRDELPRLIAMARKVERVHGSKPSCPRGLADHLEATQAELEAHLAKEEDVAFPAIAAGRPEDAPLRELIGEHDDHAATLRRTRELAGDLVPPPEACTTWRALFASLLLFERELMEHVHLENNVLFSRALAAEVGSAAGSPTGEG